MRYHPQTAADVERMLAAVGLGSTDELFRSIPQPLQLQRPLDLPAGLSEPELLQHMTTLAEANRVPGGGLLSFLGAGLYRHHVPAVTNALVSRGEFLTAYTPYQPEVAQGTLQGIFEFQTVVAELLGTEVANASMYDGATALAEAALMAQRAQRRERDPVLVAGAVHPEYRGVLRTYLGEAALRSLAPEQGLVSAAALAEAAKGCAAVLVQQPNYFGCLEDLPALAEAAHAAGALLVVCTTEPTAFGLVEAPGLQGADIVCGEGQPLGLPLHTGGPGVGLFGTRSKFLRNLPGRLVGETVDSRGQRGYVLTLATREQHIRREKATSNICTNHGLCALMVTIYLSLLGKVGLEQLARLNLSAAAYLRAGVESTPGVSLAFPEAAVFNELTLRLDGRSATALRDRLLEERGLLIGHPLAPLGPEWEDALLVNVTELHTRTDLDALLDALAAR